MLPPPRPNGLGGLKSRVWKTSLVFFHFLDKIKIFKAHNPGSRVFWADFRLINLFFHHLKEKKRDMSFLSALYSVSKTVSSKSKVEVFFSVSLRKGKPVKKTSKCGEASQDHSLVGGFPIFPQLVEIGQSSSWKWPRKQKSYKNLVKFGLFKKWTAACWEFQVKLFEWPRNVCPWTKGAKHRERSRWEEICENTIHIHVIHNSSKHT